jgi:anti-sigma regulatory factor (Ser/Thr protein kinase)
MEISLELDNTMPACESARRQLDDLFRSGGVPPDLSGELELIVEEVLVNIVNYAYPAPGAGRVAIDARLDDEGVTLVFRDHGVAFDPLARDIPDVDESFESRPIGGLGIFLTMELASRVCYERRDGSNVLTVVKRLDGGAHDAKEEP